MRDGFIDQYMEDSMGDFDYTPASSSKVSKGVMPVAREPVIPTRPAVTMDTMTSPSTNPRDLNLTQATPPTVGPQGTPQVGPGPIPKYGEGYGNQGYMGPELAIEELEAIVSELMRPPSGEGIMNSEQDRRKGITTTPEMTPKETKGVTKEDLKAPEEAFSKEFTDVMQDVENGKRKGFDGQAWKPHGSREKGNKTIAYGHKLTNTEERMNEIRLKGEVYNLKNGISEGVAQELFNKDMNKARDIARKKVKGYDTLPQKYQELLANMAFNVKSWDPKGWPNLMDAIKANDDAAVRHEMLTHYQEGGKGEWYPLESRRDSIADALGILDGGVMDSMDTYRTQLGSFGSQLPQPNDLEGLF